MKAQHGPIATFRTVFPVIVVGLVWSALSLLLHVRGHVPSGPVFVAPRDIYYAAQAGFALPVLLAQYWVLCAVTNAIAGKSVTISPTTHHRALALAFALPLGFAWLLPDLCAYAWFGFAGMAKVVRIAAPLTAVITFALVFRSLRRAYSLARGRAAVSALVGCLAQALVGGTVLR